MKECEQRWGQRVLKSTGEHYIMGGRGAASGTKYYYNGRVDNLKINDYISGVVEVNNDD